MDSKSLIVALSLGSGLLFSGPTLVKSPDGGRSWIDINPGPRHQRIVDLQVSADGSRQYALTITRGAGPAGPEARDYSVVVSADGGMSWQELEALRVTAWYASLGIAPSDPETIYVVADGYAFGAFQWAWVLRRSTDGGRTATEFRSPEEVLQPIKARAYTFRPGLLTVHPAKAETIFVRLLWAVDSDGIYSGTVSSADAGATWQFSGWAGLGRVVSSREEPAVLYAMHGNPQETSNRSKRYLAKSSDGGNHWLIKLSDVSAFALHPFDSSVLLASKEDGSFWRSDDGAENWKYLGGWRPLDRLFIHPAKPPLVLAQPSPDGEAGRHTGDLFKSVDGGETWTVLSTGMDGYMFVFDPNDTETIYGIPDVDPETWAHTPFVWKAGVPESLARRTDRLHLSVSQPFAGLGSANRN